MFFACRNFYGINRMLPIFFSFQNSMERDQFVKEDLAFRESISLESCDKKTQKFLSNLSFSTIKDANKECKDLLKEWNNQLRLEDFMREFSDKINWNLNEPN